MKKGLRQIDPRLTQGIDLGRCTLKRIALLKVQPGDDGANQHGCEHRHPDADVRRGDRRAQTLRADVGCRAVHRDSSSRTW